MRFTPMAHLPPSEHITRPVEVAEFCNYLSKSSGGVGFDCETSGLEQDGLGVEVHYVCLADSNRRVAIPVSRDHHENLEPVLRVLEDTQHRHCGFNIMYDWHALYGHQRFHLGMKNPTLLKTGLADGMKLFLHFDEEGEETYRELGLKARARHYLGLPMNDFDRILNEGGILAGFEKDYDKTLDYCTRDAWAHLGVVMMGIQITKAMPWCKSCPECGEPMFKVDKQAGVRWCCIEHGWSRADDCEDLSIWDMHRMWDMPYMHVLSKMQIRGLPVDWDYLGAAVDPLTMSMNQLLHEFQLETSTALIEAGGEAVVLNPNSTQQLAKFYHETTGPKGEVVGLGLPILGRTEGGTPAMGEKILAKLMVRYEAPGVQKLLQYKKMTKILSTYVVGLLDKKFVHTGRVHGAFRPWANTGRLRCVDGDTTLVTSHGSVKISELDLDLQEGVTVRTHRNRWRRILRVWEKGEEEMFKVTLISGDHLTCTAQHTLLTPIGWAALSQLTLGDWVCQDPQRHPNGPIASIQPVGKRKVWDITVEEDESYVAHGFVNHNSWDPNLQNIPVRDLTAIRPPAVPGAPDTPEEGAKLWGISVDEAVEELTNPDYHPTSFVINIRKAVRAPPGKKLACADYSQLEVRLTAHESGCKELIRVINEGTDMHCYTASRAFSLPYDVLYEAKATSDGDMKPRYERLAQLRAAGADWFNAPASTHLFSHLGGADRQKLIMSTSELLQAEEDQAVLDALLDVLGGRDKYFKEKRYAAKAANFGIIYGIGATGLAAQITDATGVICSPEEAKELIDSILEETFPGVGDMIRRLRSQVHQRGYVRTAMLRYRHPAGIFSGDPGKRAQARRQAQNTPIQGAAADVVNRAMLAIDVDEYLKDLGYEMIVQVHDEILGECPEENAEEALARKMYLMESSHGLITPVPLVATGNTGYTWGDAK